MSDSDPKDKPESNLIERISSWLKDPVFIKEMKHNRDITLLLLTNDYCNVDASFMIRYNTGTAPRLDFGPREVFCCMM